MSDSLKDLDNRLKDIDQLLEAHKAITKFKNAEVAAKNSSGSLSNVGRIFDALVTNPGPGKPQEVDAINRAAFVLLCSHLQGFIDDLHRETAYCVLDGKVKDVNATVKLVKPRNANPHVDIINQMFAGLGVYDLMENIAWRNCANKTVKDRLTAYIQDRNRIAHGDQTSVTKQKVEQFKKYVKTLAEKLDETVAKKVQQTNGQRPW